MRTSCCLAILIAIGLLLSPLAKSLPVITTQGAVEGVPLDGLMVYKGMPFAAPPLSNLRWRPPQPVAPWSGVRQANTFAPACMQQGVSMPGEIPPTVSEDCLYLNIWTPAKTSKDKLPVMVWIHGGGYSNGSAAMPLYWGDRLAKKGIIVITIAYRLGPFGFLAHPQLTQESAQHSSGNYGLLDQIAALRWVQRNIEAFGGDPKKVTIAGQSSGSMSVSLLIASPKARGLFQRAIGESGGVFEPVQLAPHYLLSRAEHDGETYLVSLGAASIDELRRLPAARLLQGDAHRVTHPVIEPEVLPSTPYDAYVNGMQNDVPVLLGVNTSEARALMNPETVKASTFATDLEKSFGPLPPPLIEGYPHATDQQAKQARLDLERDLRFGWDMWTWARLQAMKGRSAIYYYHFDQNPPFPANSPYAGWGASHFAELWYAFDHLDQAAWPWRDADRHLAHDMSSYWANFVKTGNPNHTGLPYWPTFSAKQGDVLYLGSPSRVGQVMNLESLKRMDNVYTQIRGATFGEK